MKFFILLALLAPVASRFGDTVEYVYKTTKNCGGYNSTLSIEKCRDNDFCMSPLHQDINATLIFEFGEDMKEPLFFTVSAVRYRRGRITEEQHDINGTMYLCNLIECPFKPDINYRIPIDFAHDFYAFDKTQDVIRLTAVIDNVLGDMEVCAARDIILFE